MQVQLKIYTRVMFENSESQTSVVWKNFEMSWVGKSLITWALM